MNEQHSSLQPAPRPMCAALSPLLPLLSLDELDPEEAVPVRKHVATCDFCRSQLRDFDALRDALRRHHAPTRDTEPVPELTLATILGAVHGENNIGAHDERDGHVAAPPLAATRLGGPTARGQRAEQGRGRWTGFGALAAALLLALLAGALFRGHGGPPAPTGIVVPVPGLGTLTEFRLPTAHSFPSAIIAGRDGNLWFGEYVGTYPSVIKIGRITPQGIVTEFLLPGGGEGLGGLAAAPDGTIRVTIANFVGEIARLNPRDSKVTEFPLPAGYYAGPIVVAPDGNLWFVSGNFTLVGGTSSGRAAIGRITPSGDVKQFPLPAGYPTPSFLTTGPDSNLWFVTGDEHALGHYVIGRMSSSGTMTAQFPIPLSRLMPGSITMVATGPDDTLWFTASVNGWYPGEIGRITSQGAIATFQMPGSNVETTSPPTVLTVGPDGNLWFVTGDQNHSDRIGWITPQGAITEFALPHGVGGIGGITLGPDGNLWFTDTVANTIDRLELHR